MVVHSQEAMTLGHDPHSVVSRSPVYATTAVPILLHLHLSSTIPALFNFRLRRVARATRAGRPDCVRATDFTYSTKAFSARLRAPGRSHEGL